MLTESMVQQLRGSASHNVFWAERVSATEPVLARCDRSGSKCSADSFGCEVEMCKK